MVLSQSDREAVKDILKEMEKEVTIMFFEGEGCEYCPVIKELLQELSELGKVKVEVYNISDEKAKELGLEGAPAIVFANNPRIRFMGIPSGHEFRAFLDTIVSLSTGKYKLSDEAKEMLKEIDKPVEIKVFVTPTCPYCPIAVFTSHKFAMENENITSKMIEAIEYQELAQKYNVMAVPKIVINDSVEFEGAVPDHVFAHYILHAIGKHGEH